MSQARLHGTACAVTDLLLRSSRRRNNVYEGYGYVPGSALRGHLAARWISAGQPIDERFRRLFQSGDVRFEHAYPLVDGQPAMPAPLTLRACKSHPFVDGHVLDDLLLHPNDARCTHELHRPEEPPGGGTLRRLRGWVNARGVMADEQVHRVLRQRIATRDDPGDRRARETDGLFSEQRLSAGTQLHVEIRGPEEVLRWLGDIVDLHSEVLAVGRNLGALGRLAVDWALDQEPAGAAPPGTDHTLTALSDLVVLDPYQRAEIDMTSRSFLAAVLGCPAEEIENIWGVSHAREVGGWDALNGMPKPVDAAIAAGSAVAFRTRSKEACAALVGAAGVGWRQAEGHGRVALDWSVHHGMSFSRPQTATPIVADDARERIAQRARALAVQLRGGADRVSRSTWQGIEAEVHAGRSLQTSAAGESVATQAASGRGAGAGRDPRDARTAAAEGFRRACQDLGIDEGSRAGQLLADDVGKELDLLDLARREKR